MGKFEHRNVLQLCALVWCANMRYSCAFMQFFAQQKAESSSDESFYLGLTARSVSACCENSTFCRDFNSENCVLKEWGGNSLEKARSLQTICRESLSFEALQHLWNNIINWAADYCCYEKNKHRSSLLCLENKFLASSFCVISTCHQTWIMCRWLLNLLRYGFDINLTDLFYALEDIKVRVYRFLNGNCSSCWEFNRSLFKVLAVRLNSC